MAFDVMEINAINDDNIVGWLAGLMRVGEVDMDSVKSMVHNVMAKLGPNGLMERLNIMDHGNKDGFSVGKDFVTVANFADFATVFAPLGPKFTGEGFVHLQACDIGKNQPLLKLMAKTLRVPVYGGTGKHNPIYRINLGDYVVCYPGGGCQTDVPRP